jgi:hypothetical protein
MVLLCNGNHVNIKNNSFLKCLEKKKNSFDVFVIPLKEIEEKSNDIYTINDTNTMANLMENLTDKDIAILFDSNHTKK